MWLLLEWQDESPPPTHVPSSTSLCPCSECEALCGPCKKKLASEATQAHEGTRKKMRKMLTVALPVGLGSRGVVQTHKVHSKSCNHSHWETNEEDTLPLHHHFKDARQAASTNRQKKGPMSPHTREEKPDSYSESYRQVIMPPVSAWHLSQALLSGPLLFLP